MKVEQGRIVFEKEHIERLKKSAAYFGFVFDETLFPLKPERDGILRFLLDKQGKYTIEYRDLEPSPSGKVRISPLTVDSQDMFLYHKTSYRPYFQVDYELFYDELYFNERGELTEGSRTNIMLEIQGQWYTPPVSCGLLNGIYRQNMLTDGKCGEKILFKEDVLGAEHIYCVNSVRGLKEVTLIG
jgi:para-aminobenzoate synthetase/4-amino-4-deoxychorismate lyase